MGERRRIIESSFFDGRIISVVIFLMGHKYIHSPVDLVQKACIHQFLEEKFHIAQFRVLDSERFQHADIAIFYRQKD